MPRRPRPQHRAPPAHLRPKVPVGIQKRHQKSSEVLRSQKSALKQPVLSVSDSGTEEEGNNDEENDSNGSSELESDASIESVSLEDESEDEFAADRARAAQWIDSDELEEASEDSATERQGLDDDEGRHDLYSLEKDLSSLPFGALLKARDTISEQTRMRHSSRSSGEDESSNRDSDSGTSTSRYKSLDKGKGRALAEGIVKPYPGGSDSLDHKTKKEIERRAHKHAPIEISSKKAVTRRRPVIEVPKIERRDPRFSVLSGTHDPAIFAKSYSFLYDLQQNEVPSLKSSLLAARKALATAPRDERTEKEDVVLKLERALKRAESGVQKWRREEGERKALGKVAEEERMKRAEGKGKWWMKESEKKKLLLKARFEALAEEGGHRAVKRVIEKKRKKVAQKEKRQRPYAKGQFGGSSSSVRNAGKDGGGRGDERAGREQSVKRQKVM